MGSRLSLFAGMFESVRVTDLRIAVCDLWCFFHAVQLAPFLHHFLAFSVLVGLVALCCFLAWMRTAILAGGIAVVRSGVDVFC